MGGLGAGARPPKLDVEPKLEPRVCALSGGASASRLKEVKILCVSGRVGWGSDPGARRGGDVAVFSKGLWGFMEIGGRKGLEAEEGISTATDSEENQAGRSRVAVFEMDGAGVAGVMSMPKGCNSKTFALGRGTPDERMRFAEEEWTIIGGVVVVGLVDGVVEVTVADFGRFEGCSVSVASLNVSHTLSGLGPEGISGGNAEDVAGDAPGGRGGSGFGTRRGSACAAGTCPRTSEGCSEGCEDADAERGSVGCGCGSDSRRYVNGFSRWVRSAAPIFEICSTLFFALSWSCMPIPACAWLTS